MRELSRSRTRQL